MTAHDPAIALPRLSSATIAQQVRALPPFPALVLELLRSLDDPVTDLDQLQGQIELDPVLAAQLLRIANSSFYGLSRQVGTVRDAAMVLGFGAVRGMVIGMSAIRHFQALSFPDGFRYENFWRHGLATGVAAELLARATGEPQGTAFTAGLLHDMGRLVVAAQFPDHWQACQKLKRDDSITLIEAEDRVMGLSHPVIGALLARHWRFPDMVIDAIEFHHQPQHARTTVAHLVHLADGLSWGQIRPDGIGGVTIEGHLCADSWARHGVTAHPLPALLSAIQDKVSATEDILRHSMGEQA